MFRRVFAVVGSVRFFILVAVVLAACAAIATLFPADGFFSGPLFLSLGFLLEASLLLCAVPRFVRRLQSSRNQKASQKPGNKRSITRFVAFAPDLVHVGLVLLIAGGVVSFVFSESGEFYLPVGAEIPFDRALGGPAAGETMIVVADAGEIHDADGLLVNWYVDLNAGGEPLRLSANHPVQFEATRFHFLHFGTTPMVRFELGETQQIVVAGEGLMGDEVALILRETGDADALFELVPIESLGESSATDNPGGRVDRRIEDAGTDFVRVEVGGRVGPFVLAETTTATLAGFRISRDPGRAVIIVALILFSSGMVMFLLKRWRSRG